MVHECIECIGTVKSP